MFPPPPKKDDFKEFFYLVWIYARKSTIGEDTKSQLTPLDLCPP